MALQLNLAWYGIFNQIKTFFLFTALVAILSITASGASKTKEPATWGNNQFIVLCYHDIPTRVNQDEFGVDLFSFIKQIEFMRDYGCNFISIKDVLEANAGKKKLPPKAVLLTFDDAYQSFYKNVFPVLKLYKIPAVLAVVSSWVDNPSQDPEYQHGIMTWSQIKTLTDSGLVTIASHSNNLHNSIICNPQGNNAPAVITRRYDLVAKKYETEEEYKQRLYQDFSTANQTIKKNTGVSPVVIVWPYGRYTGQSIEQAAKAGFKIMFTLDDGIANTENITTIPRHMLIDNPRIEQFANEFKVHYKDFIPRQRVMQTDLDLIYDKDPVMQEKNLDAFIERVVQIRPSAIYLQAFSDDAADGNIKSVYFPNRILPMKTDLFNRVSRALSIRGFRVFAWMPTLAIQLPNKEENDRLRVRQFKDGHISFSSSWYTNRLSPFAPEAVTKLEMLYEDLAKNSIIDGIVFQDDGYLNDFEDFHPLAQQEYLKITGGKLLPFDKLTPGQKFQWTELKTDKINEVTEKLKQKVLFQRPTALFARTLYASVLSNPESEEWFAQNYAKCLEIYDYTVIMAYPRMDKVKQPEKWLRNLVKKSQEYQSGMPKTVFKMQTYDWENKDWIPTSTVVKWLRIFVEEGAWNIAYYPDDYTVNKPAMTLIRSIISIDDRLLGEGK